MNDVQRKLLDDKIKELCQYKTTIFDASPEDSIADDADEDNSEMYQKQIEDILRPKPVRNVKICVLCRFFLSPHEVPEYFKEVEVAGACTFGCVRPQCPTECCKAFKGR